LSETRPGDAAAPAAPLDGHDELHAALAALPPRQRAVLVLRYFLDLPEAEVAAALQCSLGTVKSTASRGLARLEQTLRPERQKEDRIMNQLETELRAALHERAARIHASTDLLAAEYRPRTRRMWAPVAIGGGLTTAVGALVAALSLAGGASNAFAGWTPRPTAPTQAQLAATEAYCAKNLPDPGLPLKLIDARGPFTFVVYSDDSSNDFCTTGPSFTNASGWSTSPPVTVPAGKLYLWAEHTTTDAGHAYTFVIARAGEGVRAANLTLEDGTQVTATVRNGWAVAWWPGSHQLTNAQLTTPSGTQTQTFPLSPCGLHKCAGGGPHGGAPGGGPGGG
jgi:Sigma-70, region 4